LYIIVVYLRPLEKIENIKKSNRIIDEKN